MNRLLLARIGRLLILLSVLPLSACIGSGPDTTLHTLQAPPLQPLGSAFADFREMIQVLPIRLAPQLQGRGLLNRQSATEARASASHLWAGPLDQQVGDTVVRNLRSLLATANVALFPGPRYAVNRYQVEVELNEFSGNGQSFTCGAVFTVTDLTTKAMLTRKAFHQTLPINQPGYAVLVEIASQSLADLSKEVAATLLTARRRQTQPAHAHEK